MQKPGKIVIVSQHYAPDSTTTAAIITTIATHLAKNAPVLVISGTPGSASYHCASSNNPKIVEVKSRKAPKIALTKRAISEILFAIRVFFTLLTQLQKGDATLTVTAPFLLPYAVALSAKLKGSRCALIMHDLYPDVLVMAGLVRPTSIVTKIVHAANALMYRALDAVIVIGRDTEQLLLRYKGMTKDKVCFIPNWATLSVGVRPVTSNNSYRSNCRARFVVGLSGNLGFTHDPIVVFEAARLLQSDRNIHFLLSGWGMGFERLKQLQDEARLSNVTLVGRVPEALLEEFLSAADIWIIPYRKNVAGVSVPSRFYNLLAIGRPVLIISEPEAEAALTVSEYDLGWVTAPGDSVGLAETIRRASSSRSELTLKQERAAIVAERFSLAEAMRSYCALVRKLMTAA